jgi:hypothetical protein
MIHFSSVHPLRKTFNNDVVQMRFEKFLRNLNVPMENDPYCMRPVQAVIRTASGYADDFGICEHAKDFEGGVEK